MLEYGDRGPLSAVVVYRRLLTTGAEESERVFLARTEPVVEALTRSGV